MIVSGVLQIDDHAFFAWIFSMYSLLNLKKVRAHLKNISWIQFTLYFFSKTSKTLYKNDNFTLIWKIFREIDLQYIL